jgi:hypothetical protein
MAQVSKARRSFAARLHRRDLDQDEHDPPLRLGAARAQTGRQGPSRTLENLDVPGRSAVRSRRGASRSLRRSGDSPRSQSPARRWALSSAPPMPRESKGGPFGPTCCQFCATAPTSWASFCGRESGASLTSCSGAVATLCCWTPRFVLTCFGPPGCQVVLRISTSRRSLLRQIILVATRLRTMRGR